jgi:N-acetylneuraminic acid mutarotase
MRASLNVTVLIFALGQVAASAEPAAASRDDALKPMLSIAWKRGPDLPQGFQDSDGGVVADALISVGGFGSGQKGVPGKPDRYPRGFLRKVWGLSLADKRATWRELPEFPGVARQGLDAVVVGDQLYCWGGFSYSEPCCYRDGYRLSHRAGRHSADRWQWEKLPDLPWALTAHGSCAIGSTIYVVGGADYDGKTGFFSHSDRRGNVKRLGARLLTFDTRRPDDGWQERKSCPGTPRFVHAVAAVGGKVYVFGGAASEPQPEKGTHTVVDNWRYDPGADSWQRLPDLPVASGNFPSGAIVFKDRYVLLIGGYQYGKVQNPDGSTRPVYGKPTRRYAGNAMCSDVFVYDTETGTFGSATPLPLNNNLPMAVVRGDQVHLIGGEIGEALFDGQTYGHHPELYLRGTIREATIRDATTRP